MNHQRKWSVLLWVVSLGLLLSLLANCGRDHGQAILPGTPEVYIIEPYKGPCPAGQSSWDCVAWNQGNWE